MRGMALDHNAKSIILQNQKYIKTAKDGQKAIPKGSTGFCLIWTGTFARNGNLPVPAFQNSVPWNTFLYKKSTGRRHPCLPVCKQMKIRMLFMRLQDLPKKRKTDGLRAHSKFGTSDRSAYAVSLWPQKYPSSWQILLF